MLREAWHALHSHVPFPEELLASNVSPRQDVIVSDSSDMETSKKPKMSGRFHVRDFPLPNGYIVKDVPKNYTLVSKAEMEKFCCEREIIKAMKILFKRKDAER